MNSILNNNITIKKVTLMKIGLFLAFFFSYNYTIRNLIYSSSIFDIIICIFSIILLFIATFKKKVVKKQYISVFLICIFLLAFILFRNGDINNGNYGMPTIACWSVILIYILNSSTKWVECLSKVFIVFTLEHTFFTWFFYIFKDLYLNSFIIKFDTATMWLLRYQFTSGQMAGLTSHYSTNAIYLSVGVIFLFCMILNLKKNNKSSIFIILLFIFTFGALLLTGKRAHLLFSILSIFILFVINNKKNIGTNIFKAFFCIIIGGMSIILLSNFVPELLNTYDRIISFGNSLDVTNGRNVMYDLAYSKWNEHPILGNGWGTYKYIYKNNVIASDGYNLKDAHNVYLQLLCELGIVGFLFFIILFINSLVNTYKLILRMQDDEDRYKKWKLYLLFSLGIQIFFLLYCMTGNALYDCQILFPYIIAVSIMLSIKNEIKVEMIKNEK